MYPLPHQQHKVLWNNNGPILKSTPSGKWCKWHHTQELASVYESPAAVEGKHAPLPAQLPRLHRSQARSGDWFTLCVYMYIYISQLQIKSLRLWQPIAPQSSACHRTRSHLSVWSFVKIPTNTRMRAVSISIPRVAGWCLCSGVECDSPVETLQFYFRPSHTQWERSRNVSPFNYSFSGSCEILCICR